MRKNTLISIFRLSAIILTLIVSNSCTKDEAPIVKKDALITWANPSDIVVGTLLNALQLNAASDIPGSFVFTPPIGTKLSTGNAQDLKVYFTPTDTVNYNTANKTVKINVLPIDINATVWDLLVLYSSSVSWHADLTFNADGTTKYDEPDSPGVYLSYGTWQLVDDSIHFGIGMDPNYVFDGIIVNNTMNGTFWSNSSTRNWSAVKK